MTRSIRLRSWGPPLAFIAVVSVVLLAIFPKGFPNYDTIYYLLWGREIAHGLSPDYGAPLAPTPHPLYDLLGAIFSPLGDGSITVAVVLAYVTLGLLAWLVYRLGKEWFDGWIGGLAAFLVMTSAPVLSNGLRAYVDIPYMVLCLAALLIETRKPKAGWPVLALLALAGLLRPEAWLFAGFYFLWLALDVQIQPRIRVRLREGGIDRNLILMACLTAAGPVIWVLFDLITTSNPLYSFTGTRETVETLERDTGPLDVIVYGPRRLGEVMQWPGMVGAFFGVILTAWAMPKRAAIGIVSAVLALVAFAIMGASGLAIIPRYTMLAAAVLFISTAAAVLGWRLLEPGHRLRRIWQVAAAVTVALWLVWLPNQYDLLSTVDSDLSDQALVESDLQKLVDSGAFYKPGTKEVRCLPISVPNHRAVPRLAFWLDIRPSDVVSTAATGLASGGLFLAPARQFTIDHFVLDPGDETRISGNPPAGSKLIEANRSWKLYSNCGWVGYAPFDAGP